jgi:hypothetical protein
MKAIHNTSLDGIASNLTALEEGMGTNTNISSGHEIVQ